MIVRLLEKLLEKQVVSRFFAWATFFTYAATLLSFMSGFFAGVSTTSLAEFSWLSVAVFVVLLDSKICSLALRKRVSLRHAPGTRVLWIAEFLFSRTKFELVLLPIISDMRDEYYEALSQGRTWKARWVWVRGTYSFFAAIGLDRAFAFVSFFVKAWKSVN